MSVKILETELRNMDTPIGVISTTNLVSQAVEASGDPDLRNELKPGVAKGTVRIALGYTEPDGGSDIANAKTRAVRDGDEWIINGQKIFTSNAQYATHVFLITRTDPTLPKHKGMTMFLVPTSSPGFERQPLPTIADETTNVSFYTDIRLPDRYRIGEVNNGWAVLHGPLDAEHHLGEHESKLEEVGPGAGLVRPLAQSVEAAVRWAGDVPAGDGPLAGQKRSSWPGSGACWSRWRAAPAPRRRWARWSARTPCGSSSSGSSTWLARPRPFRTARTARSATASSNSATGTRRSARHPAARSRYSGPSSPSTSWGLPHPGLSRPQGVPDRRAPGHGGVASSGTGPAQPRRHRTSPRPLSRSSA